jgi:uncharacterized pyridoxamine 5'-phosphate oxidase family protein
MVVEFMRRNRRAFLFCRDESGRPVGYAMHSIGYEPGRLYFTTYAKSAKMKHLVANPAVACVVLGPQGGHDGPWLSVRGTAEIYQPSVAEVDEMIGVRPSDGRIPDTVVAKVRDRLISGKRSLIRIAVNEIRAARFPNADDGQGQQT